MNRVDCVGWWNRVLAAVESEGFRMGNEQRHSGSSRWAVPRGAGSGGRPFG